VYEAEPNTYLFHFSDRISAFDIQMDALIPKKGEVLCQFGKFWFNTLKTENHLVAISDRDKMLVKKLRMIPIEFIVRGYFYGSLIERLARFPDFYPGLSKFEPIVASKLPEPLFDPTTKSDKHDIPITEQEIIASGILSPEDLAYVKRTSIRLYLEMSSAVGRSGFIIADTKFEFGFDSPNNRILLADSLGPDEFRLWRKSEYKPGKLQGSYDKQILRDWLVNTGFKDVIDTYSKKGLKPVPPIIPPEIITRLSHRYIYAYEEITRTKF
jgi:phosphoribosylaminoimidazole-succinocarboxamide synthase